MALIKEAGAETRKGRLVTPDANRARVMEPRRAEMARFAPRMAAAAKGSSAKDETHVGVTTSPGAGGIVKVSLKAAGEKLSLRTRRAAGGTVSAAEALRRAL